MVVVLDLLRLHGATSAAVAEQGLRAVANLADHHDDADNRRRLGEAGAATGSQPPSSSNIGGNKI